MSKSSDEDAHSDSTVEETLVMLNLPQLSIDERKLKNLNIYRKKKGEKFYIENELGVKKNENSSKGRRKNAPKDNHLGSQKSIKFDLTNDEEQEPPGNILVSSDDSEEMGRSVEGDATEVASSPRGISQGGKNKDEGQKKKEGKQNSDDPKDADVKHAHGDQVDNIPFDIDTISISNLFAECPECIINNKYKFKGIHTSSIGTNLFFKEPDSLKKKKSDLSNYELSYDHMSTNMKVENKMSRDDFTHYEGYSTKIISFEIDY
ncbi:conserved Plasmodium protein, unknown function [Plasmodium knowlesi strain H]|uniref:Uncharacterized protein n=3 Tax=Plasmodium knowlesi TaxID=5850 RepID=A0A5K1V969_PLAKH|nr:conserved Plasmodium protein, unknown function [Plasmodium knowlesi strain H]OTN66152.1 Uncharacterized protein PKNOH_S09535500 [Plasmodium knowlesi]CAA9989954.1 conserved Plasmodium protein, unknown function [Plasmodium knowlesi strain H]SBO24534.1 conserved Plasmodium protein, unknown function [Plasmodium knowlesi strain H]SBO26396.1 conserved Plasmodium protein, unknown function [Plasmodium knowlesi strain H]VVS79428.1 conserved Plasmodium protein, unknown function [Plasmodium knowlesi s|eukprot:XP_002259969.1 hypothetical protein, conserved in Plasmodium species [Plasmodium knowlesi strain H]